MGSAHFHVLVGLLLAMPAVSPFEVKYVNIGHSITLPCSGELDKVVEWYFIQHMHSERLLVAKLHAGTISPGPGFEGRVESVYKEQPGNYSLVLNPAVYNDKGSYECQYKGSLRRNHPLRDVKLDIIDPVNVSIAVGMSASLPCYGGISKRARAVDLDILWKRDGKMVCQLYNNISTCGSGFENRALVSRKQAVYGNMSLTIKWTRLSDQGDYLCSYGSPKESGTPDSARLHVTGHPPQILTVMAGEELSIQLRTTDPVRVTFTRPGLDEVLMVDATEGPVTYGDHCGQRCEVLGQENTFLLRRVTLEDAGVYTVTDSETNRTISIVSLQISGAVTTGAETTGAMPGAETTGAMPWIVSTVVCGLGCIGLGLAVCMYRNKRRGTEQRIVYHPAAVEDPSGSSSRTEPQQPGGPEPSVSVSETRLDVPEPHLPVSETGPSDQTEVQEKKSEEVQEKKSEEVQGTRPWSMNN